jgi:hypothetical protein
MTLGLSRNNPGNLLQEHIPWFGLTPTQPDEGPLQFDTLTDGIRAFVKLCYTYQMRGLNSPLTFISDYSPPSAGNPTTQYVQNVCDWTGFAFDQSLNFHDTPTMIKWAAAIFRQEQGENDITEDQINVGIALAEGEE